MNDKIFVLCSATSSKFNLIFDGLENYYLCYDGEEIATINEALTPKDLKQQIKGYTLAQIKEESNKYSDVVTTVLNNVDDTLKTNFQVLSTFKTLIGTLYDAGLDDFTNFQNLNNAPTKVKEKVRDLSANYGDDNPIDDILNTMDIEDIIQQRAEPILTVEEKTKADEIAKEINKIGLLPYLDNILKDIHIGSHKNIYRKILAEFSIMCGKGSYLLETTAKAESGKSFEDDIVFDLITPPRYIFQVNNITLASFVRYALINPKYFDRVTLNFGDFGSKNSFKIAEPIFNVVKPLITENKFTYIKSDKENDTDIIEIPLIVDSIGAVYQTTKNSFTEDDDQLISRTLFSTPAKVEPKDIGEQIFYQFDDRTRQSKARAEAEQKLKDFGLYLLQMVNSDVQIINPYFDVFWEYASKSDNPIREFKQQMELFNSYCILTQDKCEKEPSNTLFASEEQLKEYMDYINLENALIPYEYDFLDMLLAKGKSKELTILYNDFDLYNEDGDLKEDIDLDLITTLVECENIAIEQINDKLQSRLDEYDIIETKADLNQQQLKELPQKLLANFGFRSTSARQRIFFRVNDLKSYYGKRTAYKNVDNVPQLLQTLYNKGYLGKYEYKHNRENLYYLTPMCDNLTSDFELKKSYDEYINEYFLNTGYNNF